MNERTTVRSKSHTWNAGRVSALPGLGAAMLVLSGCMGEDDATKIGPEHPQAETRPPANIAHEGRGASREQTVSIRGVPGEHEGLLDRNEQAPAAAGAPGRSSSSESEGVEATMDDKALESIEGRWDSTVEQIRASNSYAPTWSNYLERFPRRALLDGSAGYLVGGDILMTEDYLRRFYREQYDVELAKSVVNASTGLCVGPEVFDIWDSEDRQDITYCLSDTWGAEKPRALADVTEAAAQWMAAANVKFRYVPSADATCGADGTIKLFIAPCDWTGATSPPHNCNGGSYAPFPGDSARLMTIDYSPDYDQYTWLGVWTHELGHAIGMRHEHIRSECLCDGAPSCEDGEWCQVTSNYDRDSAMHYSDYCDSESTGQLTSEDKTGVAIVYGDPSSKVLAVLPSAWMAGAGMI